MLCSLDGQLVSAVSVSLLIVTVRCPAGCPQPTVNYPGLHGGRAAVRREHLAQAAAHLANRVESQLLMAAKPGPGQQVAGAVSQSLNITQHS